MKRDYWLHGETAQCEAKTVATLIGMALRLDEQDKFELRDWFRMRGMIAPAGLEPRGGKSKVSFHQGSEVQGAAVQDGQAEGDGRGA